MNKQLLIAVVVAIILVLLMVAGFLSVLQWLAGTHVQLG